jgi:hypothetical protein
MKKLAEWLWRACAELSLRVELSFKFTLPNGLEVTAVARIYNLGAANGMLVFASYDEIRNITKELLAAGYGFSVLDEPSTREEFDLDSFKEMFIDWGWSGELGRKPAWMR